MTPVMDSAPEGVRALVVDDEPLARDCIRLAAERARGVAVIAECGTGEVAVTLIRERKPDLVFLDVQMPGLDGFGVIESVGVDAMPPVVFVTAFDRHAVRAFEVNAVDYVLKPFEDDRLAEAIERVRRRLEAGEDRELRERLDGLLATHRGAPDPPREVGTGGYATRLLVREDELHRFVSVDDIDYIEASGNYIVVHVGAEHHRMRATLGGTLERLDPRDFVRIHRSTVVRLDRVDTVEPWFGGDYLATLRDGTRLKVSRTYRDRLLQPIS